MAYLLFPGRHLINTKFQKDYIEKLINIPTGQMDLVGKHEMVDNEKITEIIFAVTSANQSNSRYNPVPFWVRAVAIDRFASKVKEKTATPYRIIAIPHYPPSERYIDFILKEIHENTYDHLTLNPQNTLVLCSTPKLVDDYVKKGFGVLTAEYDYYAKERKQNTPVEIIKIFAESDEGFGEIEEMISEETLSMWRDFPEIPETIRRIWRDPLLNESGSLTEERNYSTYAQGMGHTELINLKYQDIKEALVPGKIVDEGCADGSLIVLLARDFPDSDIIGIEITSEFMARCIERQRAGEFGGTFVHFHQKNLLDSIFEDNSIDTTICNSTTHEIWSYGSQKESLYKYFEKKFRQMRSGGRLIIRDVVGPENKDKEVYLWLNNEDGENEDIFENFGSANELETHIKKLSTEARFKRFANDYLNDMRIQGKRTKDTQVRFREEKADEKNFFVTTLRNSAEFLSKKDYADNWQSEMNEEFTFFDFKEWKGFLKNLGFRIIENPNQPSHSSRVYTNQWIVDNRYKDKVKIFEKTDGKLVEIGYPPTNVVLIAEKP